MKVNIYSRKKIEKALQLDFLHNVAVISFYDIGDEPVDFGNKSEQVFFVCVDDIDIDDLAEYNLTYDEFFPEHNDLAEFIYEAKEKGMDIICQCEYGESRSAGCASAIQEHFYGNGISIFSDYRFYPSKLIYHKLIEALDNQKKKYE